MKAAGGRPALDSDPLRQQLPLVSAGWLLRAIVGTLAVAAICAYATLCLLFYQGQWQLLFHPSASITTTPGLPYNDVRFDYTETGTPLLDGWWIPGDDNAQRTILFLHDGQGSLSNAVGQLRTLQALGANVFAFDYRGFGRSAHANPSEQRMNQDADAAWAYLTDTRHLPPDSIAIYGVGQGAAIAADLARRHPEAAAIVLDTPSLPALTLIKQDPRSRLLPVHMLLKSRFDPEKALMALHTPKLFLERASPGSAAESYGQQLFRVAASPKMSASGSRSADALRRFLTKY